MCKMITTEFILKVKEAHEFIWDYVYERAKEDFEEENFAYDEDDDTPYFHICEYKEEATYKYKRKYGEEVKLISNCALCGASNVVRTLVDKDPCTFCVKFGFTEPTHKSTGCLKNLWDECFYGDEEGLESIRKIRDLFRERGI